MPDRLLVKYLFFSVICEMRSLEQTPVSGSVTNIHKRNESSVLSNEPRRNVRDDDK